MEPVKGDAADAALVEWAAVAQAMRGEETIGDHHVVASLPKGVLVAVVDGLGHGAEAAHAAQKAVELLRRFAHEPVEQLVRRCHEGLRGTRGVAMTVASFSADRLLTWLGVGNVEGVVFHSGAEPAPAPSPKVLIPSAGVVGYRIGPLRPSSLKLHTGDFAIFATDGVKTDFAMRLRPIGSVQRIADRILAEYGKGTDDALVLVLRYLGGAA
jgi:hypothetical protein